MTIAGLSSAAGEDAAGESFAGLHDSFLFLHGSEARVVRDARGAGLEITGANPEEIRRRARVLVGR